MTFYCITHNCADYDEIYGITTIYGDEGYIADCGGVAYMLARAKDEAIKKFGNDYSVYDVLGEASLLYPTCDFDIEVAINVEV